VDFAELAKGNKVAAVEFLRDTDDGGRVFSVRGMFRAHFAVATRSVEILTDTETEPEPEERGALEPEARDDHEPSDDRQDDIPMTGTARIRGIASSTGVDWYGTEMTHNALLSMQRQFSSTEGRAYVPTHWESEWMQVIGTTRSAEIMSVDRVDNPADPGEPAFVLWVESDIDLTTKRGRELVKVLRTGRGVGQSIGGWFTNLTFQEDRNGDIERIFVNDVELDHLAATRTPANSDSEGLGELRGQLGAETRSRFPRENRTAPTTPAPTTEPVIAMRAKGGGPEAPEVRHVLGATETENTVIVQFLKAGRGETDLDDEEMIGELSTPTPDPETRDEDPDTRTTEEPPAEELPEEPPAEELETLTTPGEADVSPPTTEESTMTPEDIQALAAAIGTTVGATIDAALDARGVGTSGNNADNDPDPDPDPDPEKSEREKELEARIARMEQDEIRRVELIDRLAAAPRGRARSYENLELLTAATAIEHGDFGPLIERAKEEGQRPLLVRVMEKNTAVRKVLDGFEDHEDTSKRLKFSDIKRALRSLFLGYEADGGFTRDTAAGWRN
jgi:hypothetical protein